MTIEDDGVDQPRVSRRRKQIAGVLGLAAVLGGGAYAITSEATGKSSTAQNAGAVESLPTGEADSVTSSASAPASASATGKQAGPILPKVSLTDPVVKEEVSKSPEERIKAAREAAAKGGVSVKHPRTATSVGSPEEGGVTEQNIGSLKEGGSMRIVSAPYDLTGRREMLWAADGGHRVGTAKCTNKLQLSNEDEPTARPTLLLCWRTSAKKSVITVAVVPTGRPNAAKSVAALDKQWNKMP
ncbi:hypothetical protein GCM10010172_19760 [Paractinoplanes ferrugineus]|uniref:Uncharacterized protein n=1 Tax=Paractinoplanes ferrugineus TaxID=113564 RepID=A0A919J7N0_9ACTN|nr:hypothetical protein [Actinoplanes ferrugineus]GIE12081.1 hypothetical protein Afe05nite_39210 [Actinoplanes ferrugineus]